MLESGFYNMDCMDAMREFPDKFFELCICDPPYGISITDSGRLGKYCKNGNRWDDCIPSKEYFDELFRVSENQIIWGGNYFALPPTRGFVIWDKKQPQGISFASCEFAWTSFNTSAKTFYLSPMNADVDRIHPTQKPVALYMWLLQNYAKRGDKILDTHVGSASSLIACHRMGFEYWGMELDKDYFDAASERLEKEKAQQTLFSPEEIYKPQQQGLSFEE
jgi:site-specific DNA-methyltransferase (adenine-specific)